MGDFIDPDAVQPQVTPGKEPAKDKPFWNWVGPRSLGETFRYKINDNDPEAQAMIKSIGYLGGLAQTGLAELARRAVPGGESGVSGEDWKAALRGEAKTVSDYMKESGWGGVTSTLAGIPIAAMSDPLGGFLGNASYLKNPGIQNPWNIVKQVNPAELAEKTGQLIQKAKQPISTLINKTGRMVFGMPFRSVESKLLRYKNSNKIPKGTLTNLLWNEGTPLVKGSNIEIAEQVGNLRKATYQKMRDLYEEAGLDTDIDLASLLQGNILLARANEARTLGKKLKEMPDPMTWFYGKLRDENTRAEAIDLLKNSAPGFSDVFDSALKSIGLKQESGEYFTFLQNFIEDLIEKGGVRPLDEAQELALSYGRKATNNSQTTNFFKRGINPSPVEFQSEKIRQGIQKLAEETTGTSEKLAPIKKLYHLLAKSELPIWRIAEAAESRVPVSKLDLFLLGSSLSGALGLNYFGADPKMSGTFASGFVPAKIISEMFRSPRLGTKFGSMLGSLAKSNLMDNMVKRSLIDASRQRGPALPVTIEERRE